MMLRTAGAVALAVGLSGCALIGEKKTAEAPGTFVVEGRIIEKTGRCHTIQARESGDLYAVDRGVLSGLSTGTRVILRARTARQQSCLGVTRVLAESVSRWAPQQSTRLGSRKLLRRSEERRTEVASRPRNRPIRLPNTGGTRAGHVGPTRPATKVFRKPVSGKYPLDWCLRRRAGCGLDAAMAFCKRQGYRRAMAASTFVAPVTRVHSSGQLCRSTRERPCRGYHVIRCG